MGPAPAGSGPRALLIVVADDFGLHPSYDRGIVAAARAGVIDAVSVMALRSPALLDELAATGVALGLHAEAGGAGERLTERGLRTQLGAFERLSGRAPSHLDGHRHCHAAVGVARLVAAVARERGLPTRSIDAAHRRLLRAAGVRTPDLLVGRFEEDEPALPHELERPPPGVAAIEWMVHPGHPDRGAGSRYDRGRGEDLEMLLRFQPPAGLVRADHRALRAA